MARNFPQHTLATPFASTVDVLTYQWLHLNRRITRLIAQHGLDAEVIAYRDLARYPETELRRLSAWLGMEYEPGQCDYWNFDHHGTQKTEYEWVKNQRSQHIDLRWQTELDEAEQKRIITNPDVEAYLGELGLRIRGDGLTQRRRPR
jgi:hypothetical protein